MAKEKKFDLVGNIMSYEDGSLDAKSTNRLFKQLNKAGLTNKLQGHYGRQNALRKKQGK